MHALFLIFFFFLLLFLNHPCIICISEGATATHKKGCFYTGIRRTAAQRDGRNMFSFLRIEKTEKGLST